MLALPGVPPFELGIPSRVFGSAWDADGRPLYEVTVCTADGAPVLSDAGFTVQPATGPAALAAADTVIIPPTHAMPELGRGGPLPPEVAAAIGAIRPGASTANRAARMCVAPPWRDGGQAQFIDRPVPEPTLASTTATRAWALEHLAEPLTLARLAEHARMSLRSFTRRFRDEVGVAPGQWLTAQRLELAKQLLETTGLAVDLVAHRAGLGSGNSLRAHMRTAFGVSPAAYRRTFGTGSSTST
ncbi:GlxA family transcriptional regulator [Streptomyces vietnamensis]|uniref:GlxA family transcriptional regulator n=1 Tax=Streptomyces vietnamensis TaxID=362257 RepID=UPI003796166C